MAPDPPGSSTHLTAADNKSWGNCVGILALNSGGGAPGDLPAGNYTISDNQVWANNMACPGAAPTPAIADHLKRDFTATAPGTRLVGDITYVRTWTGWLSLATVIDCHTKAVVGWSMAEHMRTDLICDAITMAAAKVQLAPDAVFHSDRGTQYTSAQFAAHLSNHNMVGSGTYWYLLG